MVDPSVVVAVVSLIISIGSEIAGNAQGTRQSSTANSVQKVINSVSNKLNANSRMQQQVIDAYNNKQSDLFTQLARGSGMSVRDVYIKKALNDVRARYGSDIQDLQREAGRLSNDLSTLNTALTYANTFGSQDKAIEIANKVAEDNGVSAAEQSTKGGLQDLREIAKDQDDKRRGGFM